MQLAKPGLLRKCENGIGLKKIDGYVHTESLSTETCQLLTNQAVKESC